MTRKLTSIFPVAFDGQTTEFATESEIRWLKECADALNGKNSLAIPSPYCYTHDFNDHGAGL